MTVAQTRAKILTAAESLFFHDGIAITGVDRVASAAEVSVVTLYKHMGSKDGLLVEVLQRRLDRWGQVWQEQIDAASNPPAKVLAIFEAVSAYRELSPPAQWCSFLATTSERAGADDLPARMVAADTALLHDRLQQLATAADPGRADEIVATVSLLYNGVLSSLLRGHPVDPVGVAATTARAALGWPHA